MKQRTQIIFNLKILNGCRAFMEPSDNSGCKI